MSFTFHVHTYGSDRTPRHILEESGQNELVSDIELDSKRVCLRMRI